MARDTRSVLLTDAQRFNHYPATPLCSISWWFSGTVEMLEAGAPATLDALRTPVPARTAFVGPHTRPTVSWSAGPSHGMMLLLLPDALRMLTGIDPGQWLNRVVAVDAVLPPAWCALCAHVAAAPDDAARVRLIESFVNPLWQSVRPDGVMSAHRYGDWVQGLALRAATSRTGRSLRQIERRIRNWTGQPLRELRGFGRAEHAFFDAMADTPRAGWASVADEAGYSDQSHLCRATRRMTGFAPEELRRRIASDEGFWPYRVWQ